MGKCQLRSGAVSAFVLFGMVSIQRVKWYYMVSWSPRQLHHHHSHAPMYTQCIPTTAIYYLQFKQSKKQIPISNSEERKAIWPTLVHSWSSWLGAKWEYLVQANSQRRRHGQALLKQQYGEKERRDIIAVICNQYFDNNTNCEPTPLQKEDTFLFLPKSSILR